MNSKWHLYVSIFKSFIRMFGCVLALVCNSWAVLAVFLLVAEMLGVLEELKDER